MIAAGSLFTSCVENAEPQGIKDLREAKADYLASLSKLREADAEKVKAEAAVELAKAEVQKAIAAQNQALAEAQQIANEAASIVNEEAAARAKAAIDTIKARAELDAVIAQEALAQAQAKLDKALRKIVAESIGLTGDEKEAIWEKTFALNMAYSSYNAWLDAYNGAVKELWEAEYAVITGKEGYETADSYRDSIDVQNDLIADANENIASLEALKEHPQAVKDTLDAIDAQIASLYEQWTLIQADKTLYESTPGFVAAKSEFAKRVETFENDSLNIGKFAFIDFNEDGDTVAVEYALTDGKGVDKKFGDIIKNNNWAVSEHVNQSDATITFYHLVDDGFNYAKNAVQVGKTGIGYATPEQLTEGLDVLDQIVETLNRELVVIDNIKDSTSIEDAKKAAEDAWKAYTTDRDTLEDGLKDYKPYKDSLAQKDKLAEDTVKAKKAKDAAAAALKTVNAENKKKEAAQIEAVKTTAAAYESAVKKLAAEIATYGNLKVAKTADSTKFIAAINAFGEAQAAFLGHQDSVKYEKGFDQETGDPVSHTDPISKLNIDYFRPNKEGKAVYTFGLVAVVENICKNTKTGESVWTLTEKQLLAAVENPLPKKGEGKTAADSIKAVEKNPTVAAAIKAFKDYKEVVEKAEYVADSTADDFKDAKTKLAGYHGEDDAIAAYKEVYKRFWSVNDWKDIEKDTAATKFTWTDKTFLEPENCVEFTYHVLEEGIEAKVLFNSTLKTILDNVDPDGYLPEKTTPNMHRIFRSEVSAYNLTEFAQALLAAQIVEDLGEYVPNKARLEKINAQVAQIREDVEAAIAEYEAGFEGLEEVLARYYGVDEDGKLIFVEHPELTVAHVADGEWNYGGYLLEWAEELAPEYPAIVKAVNDKAPALLAEIGILKNYRNTLDLIYTVYSNIFEDPAHAGWNVQDIINALNVAIEQQETVIAGCEIKIAGFEETIDAYEAGYSHAEAKVAPLKKTVEAYKKLLEQAEEALKRAQAEYDAVIALYGVNE